MKEEGRYVVAHLARCLDCHGTLDEIEDWHNAKLVESLADKGPRVAEVSFAVFGKQRHEGRLLEEGAGRVLLGEGLDLPLVNVVRVPRLGLLVGGRHVVGGLVCDEWESLSGLELLARMSKGASWRGQVQVWLMVVLKDAAGEILENFTTAPIEVGRYHVCVSWCQL